MSEIFVYICTKTTADPYIPPYDTHSLARDVSDAFVALSGGYRVVGQLGLYPLQRSVPSHLLCDGQEVAKVSFPELYDYLGDTQGTPADADNFVLPNYLGDLTPAAVADPETVNEGTVSTPGTGDTEGAVDSGGRPRKTFREIPEP
jgi:tail collar domain